MILAKCDWVYQGPCLKRAAAVLGKSRRSQPLHVVSGANQVQKKIRAAHAKEKQRI